MTLPSFIDAESPLATTVRRGLAATEVAIRRLLSVPDQALTPAIQFTVSRPAKRLRPLVAILGSLAVRGDLEQAVIKGAAAVEALHLASLLHDDVIDEAALRSGLPTCNARLGNRPAVLLGDFLFARALLGAAKISPACLQRFLRAAEDLVTGEFGQNAASGVLPAAEHYLSWIEAKTASLFILAASLGRAQAKTLQDYGRAFGLAYQLRDDLFDLIAGENQLGKPAWNDCRRGLFTYPVILACAAEPKAARLMAQARPADPAWRRDLSALLHRSGAVEQTRETCRCWADRARESLAGLPPSLAREALESLAVWVGEAGG